jgi:hypothetical protein
VIVGGGGWKDFVVLLTAPFYVIWKLMMLPALARASRGSTAWVRTERTGIGKSS